MATGSEANTMKLDLIRPFLSLTAPPTSGDEVEPFIVLSGPNGSGKSQLLEAIQQGFISVDGQVANAPHFVVRRFVANQLVPPSEGAQGSQQYRDSWVNLESNVTSFRAQVEGQEPGLSADHDDLDARVAARLVEARQLTMSAVETLRANANKRLIDLDAEDYRRHAPLIGGIRDPFQFSIAELFLSYHSRKERNEFQQWRLETGKPDASPMSDGEFENKFGPPPWEVLDETLKVIGLDYEFVRPDGPEENRPYEVKLRHLGTGAEVPTAALSSGEKTLVAIAMTLFSGARMGDSIELPHVLLLDEADSGLHPSMVKNLLTVVRDILVATYGVKVILTTHSPTTVALAPEESLYVMRRSPDPRLLKARDRDEALNSLTVGLSTLSVRVENRRTVFVESENDEQCYHELFRIVGASMQTDFSLEFVASGRGGQGNSAAVLRLVKELRSRGNDAVWGLVDRDDRGGAAPHIVFNPERYAIENLVLDPLIVGAFMLREGLVAPPRLGLSDDLRHLHLDGRLHGQTIVDAVCAPVTSSSDDIALVDVAYLGDFQLRLPRYWLDTRGHDLEDRVIAAHPQLRRYRDLSSTIVSLGFGDHPAFIPKSATQVFAALLS
ncbi:MAG: ATP-binding protein [Solirubrobacteraceae bacterium]|nr:ATP-binding protein [Solirubrobacteraceae bacterium]